MTNSQKFAAALAACIVSAAPAAMANITINGTSYSSGVGLNTANGKFTITGTASGYVQVKQNCTIVLDGVTWTDSTTKTDAIQITDGLTVNLQLKGANKITCSASGGKQTGIRVTSGTTLNITNLTDRASLTVTATAGYRDVAIGGSYNDNSDGSACGTINVYGGTITAKSGYYGAGIGGFCSGSKKLGTGGTVRVYGGVVNATGGTNGAGVGGGYYSVAGAFYNYGGTVYATRGSDGAADIGSGASASSESKTFYVSGGSTGLANGSVTGMAGAVNPDGERVYRIVLTGLAEGKKYVFDGISDKLSYTYGQNNIVADSNGEVHVWLPPAEHVFTFDEDGKRYQFATANATGKQTLSPVEIATSTTVAFVNWDGSTISESTDDPGAALAVPDDPVRTGYTFAGWSPAVPSVYPDKNATYTATWTVNRYTVSFDTDGGAAMDDASFDYGAAVAVPDPVREGYVFTGWSPALPATMPAENLSVKATWDLAPFFRLVSVSPGADGKVSVTYDSYKVDLSGGDFALEVKNSDGATVATVKDWIAAPSTEEGEQTAVWDASGFLKTLSGPTAFSFSLAVGADVEAKYLVVDLSDGSREYLGDVPAGGWTDEYKTSKLVLRKILGEGETATFTMGSPAAEVGRKDNETQHEVTLTKPYWIGVFEFTQGQWAAVKGASPTCAFSGATRPVETVAWVDLKGALTGYGATSATGASFIGTLRSRTGSDLGLNLPTEAEWEYACRAGTTGAYAGDLDALAVHGAAATAVAGSKEQNAWGLYDMHGNVAEWCHDMSYTRTADAADLGASAASDPTGNESSSTTPYRVYRGGEFDSSESDGNLRSARRRAWPQADTDKLKSGQNCVGFRVAAREFAGEASVSSAVQAEGTAEATLGRVKAKGLVIRIY